MGECQARTRAAAALRHGHSWYLTSRANIELVRAARMALAGVWQCVAGCCSVLQCVAVCCSVCSEFDRSRKHRVGPPRTYGFGRCVAVWYGVWHCVAVFFSVVQCVAECCSVFDSSRKHRVGLCRTYGFGRCVTVWCGVLQCVQCVAVCAVCFRVLQCICQVSRANRHRAAPHATLRQVCCSVLQCVAVRCSVLQCVAVCCSALQRVLVFCYNLSNV